MYFSMDILKQGLVLRLCLKLFIPCKHEYINNNIWSEK